MPELLKLLRFRFTYAAFYGTIYPISNKFNGEIMDLRNYYGDKADEKVLLGRIEKVKNAFYSHEKVKPERLFSSSGRAEILGNHTDHNHGKVLVAAISCDILAAVKKTDAVPEVTEKTDGKAETKVEMQEKSENTQEVFSG